MVRRHFFWNALLLLVLIGGLLLGGVALYRMGWSQGVLAGSLIEAPAEGQVIPPAAYYPLHWGYGMPFFPAFIPILFCFGGLFLLFILFGGLFRFKRMHHWEGSHNRWKQENGQWKGEAPPWVKEWHDQLHKQPPASGSQADQPGNP